MHSLFTDFYLNIGKRGLYWGPLLLFSLFGYSFSIFNRTIHWDDLLKEYYNETMLSNRWGMVLWGKIMGTLDLVPFTDRFLTLLFLIFASILMSVLFFHLNKRSGDVLSYTVLSSMVLTYPLINEIFEYTGADFQYTGNMSLILLSFIYLSVKSVRRTFRVFVIATILMILPASSYEVGIFSYITLSCAVILYKYCIVENRHLSLKMWLYENIYLLLPLAAAVIIRFIVAYFLREIYDIPFYHGGSTGIGYENTTLSYLLGSNLYRYFFAGLVYFPITVFDFSVVIFFIFIMANIWKNRNCQVVVLGLLFFISVFFLTIIQRVCMQYRTAQTLVVFVSFISFLLCNLKTKYCIAIRFVILFLCFRQAVYLNSVLSLNNMRSDNEAACIRYVGNKLVSEFDHRKPIVLITNNDYYGGYLGPWIDKRVHADLSTWNGRIFTTITERYLPQKYHNYKYVNSNINNAIGLAGTHKNSFQYYGYNVNIQELSTVKSTISDTNRQKTLDVIFKNEGNEIPPLGIKDIGECIFVNMIL